MGNHRQALKTLVATVGLLAISSTAFAGAGSLANPQHITRLEISFNTNVVYMTFDANLTGTSLNACASSHRNMLAFDSTTPKGRSYLTMVTAAYLAGRAIRASGTGSCDAGEPNIEGLAWFAIM
jgi:hypothetical protein